ncbi:MAG: hypothetical protein FWD49_06220 [Firmicutes bacterium]|nr:hypothetical protein [Bacillota bacterium]
MCITVGKTHGTAKCVPIKSNKPLPHAMAWGRGLCFLQCCFCRLRRGFHPRLKQILPTAGQLRIDS